jgi:hypothetical protein
MTTYFVWDAEGFDAVMAIAKPSDKIVYDETLLLLGDYDTHYFKKVFRLVYGGLP